MQLISIFRQILLCIALNIMFVHQAFGDQLFLLTKEQSNKAFMYLKEQIGKDLIQFCGCCDNSPKVYFKLSDVFILEEEIIMSEKKEKYFKIKVAGTTIRDKQNFDSECDLAYIWVQKGNKAVCLGRELDFDCNPCAIPFIWDDNAQSTNGSIQVSQIDTNLMINNIVRRAGLWSSNAQSTTSKAVDRKFDSLIAGQGMYEIVEKKFNRFENLESFAVIDPNRGSLWAGALVQGRNLQQGQLTPLGRFPRAPITITVAGGGAKEIKNPSFASVDDAIREMLNNKQIPHSAQIYMNVVEQRSQSQARCDIGAKVGFLPFSFEGKFSNTQENNQNSLFLVFKQIYYTVSVEDPSSPQDFFGANVNLDEFQQKVSSGNPLCYVSSVSYGRLIIAKFTANSSLEDLQTSAQASFGKLLKFDANAQYQAKGALQNASCEVLVIGGTSKNSANAVSQMSFGALLELVKTDAQPTPEAVGEPISYSVCSDDLLFAVCT